MPMPARTRQCPMCETRTTARWCCGIDLAVRRRPWRMTPQRVRAVHIVARVRKGLDEDTYRMRLATLGVETSKQFSREQFRSFMAGLRSLPDAPRWRHRTSSTHRTYQRGIQ
jgi:hypothetical protein